MHHHHHDHHHHGRSHDHDHDHSGIGQRNQAHFDNVAADIFDTPWIKKLTEQISGELREQVGWIGFPRKNAKGEKEATKMLDYACGNGIASRALAPSVTTTRGIDISSAMVEQYNILAKTDGYDAGAMHAVHGDLVDGSTNPATDLSVPEFSDFDLIVMSMALHHVDSPEMMIKALSEKLGPRGVLLIIDWVAESESGCAPAKPPADDPVRHTVSRMGFEKNELGTWFGKAGLGEFGWRWFSSRSHIPDEMGGEKQLFLARAVRS